MIINYFEMAADFNLPPAQAIAFFRDKGLRPTFSYLDMVGEEHDAAFTVAKMMDVDLLETVRGKLDDALANGTTLADFQKELIPTLQKAGWWGKKDMIDPLTGTVVEAQLGSATRLENIFRTNLQSAYAAGHWESIVDQAGNAPYLMYDAVDDDKTRATHAANDGLVLPIGSPFWDTHYPPNDYGCRCGVIQVDENELADYGMTPSAEPKVAMRQWTNPRTGMDYMIPEDVGPSFAHNSGKSRMAKLDALAAEKAAKLPKPQADALADAQGKLAKAQTASKIQAQAEKALKELQKAETVGTFQKQHHKAQQRAAQWQIDQAKADKTPYLANALKQVAGTKKGAAMTPEDLLKAAKDKAASAEQNAMIQGWKQAMIKGKTPPEKASKYVATLPDEIQDALNAEIEAKNGTLLAKEELKTIAAGNAAKQAGLKKTIFNKWSKDGTAGEYKNPKDLLAAITKEAAEQQAKKEKASALSGYKKKVLAGKIPTEKQQKVYNDLPQAEKDKLVDAIEAEQAKTAPPAPTPPPAPKAPPAKPEAAPKAKAKTKAKATPDAPEMEPAKLHSLNPSKQYEAYWNSSDMDEMLADLGMEDDWPTPAQVAKMPTKEKKDVVGNLVEMLGEMAENAEAPHPDISAQQYINKLFTEGKAGWGAVKTKAKPVPKIPLAPKAGPDMDNLIQTGPQKGSNPGGKYQDTTTGQEWYIKNPETADHAKNELLAGKLYQAAGVEVPDLELVEYNGQTGIASKIIDGVEKAPDALKANRVAGVHENLAVDAWLGNWDVVGLEYDNLLVKAGRAVRVDTGGALRYRAQGGMKGAAWGKNVTELDTLRDQGLNPQAASVFNNATDDQIRAGVTRLAQITDSQIDDLVRAYGPDTLSERNTLAATLKARRDDLVARFGVNKPKAAPAPLKGVSKAESDRITQARQNGYAVPMDKDAIEDQQVLFWRETSAAGEQRTHAQLKIRGKGLKAMEDVIAKSGAEKTVDVKAKLDSKIKETIKGLRAIATKEGLRDKDISRVREAAAEFKTVQKLIADGVADGTISAKDQELFEDKYSAWIGYLEKIAKKKPGSTFAWAPNRNGIVGGVFNPLYEIRPTPKAGGFEFKLIEGTGFKQKRIERGMVIELDQELNSPDFQYYQGTIEGVEVRFWGKNAPQALKGRVELIGKGVDADAASKALAALERAGIDTTRPSALDAEELYLRQIAYHRNDIKIMEAAEKLPTQAARIESLKTDLSRGLAKPIDKMPGYNPTGRRQAFDEGFVHRTRPDLPEKEWAAFQKDHRLFHENTGSMTMPELMDVILNSGGKMAPTTDKMRRGVNVGGMSPVDDIHSGGAQYFFTRIRKRTNKAVGFYFKARNVARLDAISYDDDYYGKTTGSFVTDHRETGIKRWAELSEYTYNETVLKDGISILDEMDYLLVSSKAEADSIIKVIKSHGYKTWPDGRKLTEVIVYK